MMSEEPPRLKTAIRVSALMRRLESAGAFPYLRRRGDADAGIICLKLCQTHDQSYLLTQQRQVDGTLEWQTVTSEALTDDQAEALLTRMLNTDPDLWIVEIEDPRQFISLEML